MSTLYFPSSDAVEKKAVNITEKERKKFCVVRFCSGFSLSPLRRLSSCYFLPINTRPATTKTQNYSTTSHCGTVYTYGPVANTKAPN